MRNERILPFLNEQIRSVQDIFNDLLNDLSKNVGTFKFISGVDWNSLRQYDPSLHRSINYTKDKFAESFEKLREKSSPHKSLLRLMKPTRNREAILNSIEFRFKKRYSLFIKHEESNGRRIIKETVSLGDVVRRIQNNAEFSPLNITFLDAELFALCFCYKKYKIDLTPEEQKEILSRIKTELEHYLDNLKEYHDLSTVWWAQSICLIDDLFIHDEEKFNLMNKFMNQQSIKYITQHYTAKRNHNALKLRFITAEGNLKRGYERHQKFVTELRSVSYCYENANRIKEWMRKQKDPRQPSLLKMIREFEDACGAIGLAWCKADTSKWLYTHSIKLEFINNLWRNRIWSFQKAISIKSIRGRKDTIKNRSGLPSYVSTDEAFSKAIRSAKTSITIYSRSNKLAPSKRPFVIGLFGNPGAGKSHLAKTLCESEIHDRFHTVNLSTVYNPEELFKQLFYVQKRSDYKTSHKVFAMLLDEFDVKHEDQHWYRWLLTLLWDKEIPIKGTTHVMMQKMDPCIIFLAASRYERFSDFREYCLSSEGKSNKAVDLLSRIDYFIDIPDMTPDDRYLVLNALTHKKADHVLTVLCYLAELDDGARGMERLFKGVKSRKGGMITLSDLTPPAKNMLLRSAGILNDR